MKLDMHYYGVYVMAKLAEFDDKSASTIAYSSQYVDDADDSDKIVIGDFYFDTVHTAHAGLRSFDWGLEKRVFIPFHFLPPKRFRSDDIDLEPYSYITEPHSEFVLELLDNVLKDKTKLGLYRLGIALHTYMDTWSHESFSGRNHDENDVEDLQTLGNKWKPVNIWKKVLDVFEDLFNTKAGHMQAWIYPDLPYLTWKYHENSGKKNIKNVKNGYYERDNQEAFLSALKNALSFLLKKNKGNDNELDAIWEIHESTIRGILSTTGDKEDNMEERCKAWIETYKIPNKNSYKKEEWREIAFEHVNINGLSKFIQTDYAYFHKAAQLQKHFVLEGIM